jgi:lysophospholipase L1-like esterase
MQALLLAAVILAAQPHRESIEWCDAWLPHMKDSDLPRVILIGDSITRGYYAAVEEQLKPRAYVARIATSKAIGDPALLKEIHTFLTQAKFDVIHVNIGMHGWDYTEAEYKQHLPALLKMLRKSAPSAKITWAQTTPIRKDRDKGATNQRIQTRNDIAKAFFDSNRIPINDLHALMLPHTNLHSDDIHFNKEGSTQLAKQVAGEIEKQLTR